MAYQSKYTGLQIDDILDSVEWKQGKIEDLASIRAGAQKGATALQSYTEKYTGTVTGIKINGVVKSGSGVIDLGTISTPTKTSQLENDNNFITSEDVAAVALSGSYNDLHDAPSIPAAVTESTVSGWGFTKNTGTYSKPSTGIPKTDLASAVQTSLGKADTALQSYTEQYKGTITGVSANGTSVATSGVANIPAASTSTYGVIKLSTATNNTSTTLAATASAVKKAYDLANGKQDKLVSGTNIKTINGESILGSGDIEISGGSSSGGGEDIRYFTDFTVEDFIEGCENGNTVTYDTTELFNAMKSNKVICVPYRGYDKGFIVASYKSSENVEYPEMYLQKGDVEYYAWTGDSHELVGEYPTFNSIQCVEIAGGEVFLDVLDNYIYRITDPVDYLFASYTNIQKGTTIHFVSGEGGTTIEMTGVYWANGEIPQIEPNTFYELSLMQNVANLYNVVLTPFKQVE